MSLTHTGISGADNGLNPIGNLHFAKYVGKVVTQRFCLIRHEWVNIGSQKGSDRGEELASPHDDRFIDHFGREVMAYVDVRESKLW